MQITGNDLVLYKKKICEIAKAFDAFCTKHDLRYFGIGGTAIGALRHKGIIPWDDDIDFVMPRPDYERFLQICGELLPKYDVFTHRSHPLYHLTMAKMCDANTSYLSSFAQHQMIGAFIDIFPMDGCPGATKEERVKFFNEYRKLRSQGEAIQNFYSPKYILSLIHTKNWSEIPNLFRSYWYHFLGRNNDIFEKCDQVLMANPFDSAEYVAYFSTYRSAKIISPREWFDDCYYVPFEDFQIRLPKGIHEYLTQLFGDYMTPPPRSVIDVDYHGCTFIDLNKRVTWEEARQIVKNQNQKLS